MSTLEVNKITPQGVATEVTLGDSGDTFTIPSGVTLTNNGTVTGIGGENTPAFLAQLSSTQTIGDDTFTKIAFNTEVYDTASAYDNSTNYRFTVPSGEGGKYFFYSTLILDSDVSSNLDGANIQPRKNGVATTGGNEFLFFNNQIRLGPVQAFAAIELAVGDYIEIFARIEAADSSGGRVSGSFGAYKLIGA